MLTFKWTPELSDALPFEARAFHGETFQLIAFPRNYAEALTGLTGVTVSLYWQTPDMTAAEWYVEEGSYDAETGAVSAVFDGTKDTGADSITFYLSVTMEDGAAAFRIYGRIHFKASPGFIPAEAVSQMETTLKTWAEGTYLPEAKAQAEAAAKSATAAATSEENAGTSEENAKASEKAAADSAQEAKDALGLVPAIEVEAEAALEASRLILATNGSTLVALSASI